MFQRSHYYNAWDVIVTNFIRAREPFPGYWARSEKYALGLVESHLLQKTERRRLLDLGCGTGRLLARYANFFHEVVALEPDPERYKQALDTCKANGLRNVTLYNSFFEDYECTHPFDVVFCSHVIQHIEVDSVQVMMAKIEESLREAGILILLTSYSRSTDDKFTTWTVGADRRVFETTINQEEFDRCVADSADQSALPIRAFGRTSLEGLLRPQYRVKEHHYMHALHPRSWLDKLVFRDKWMNWPLVRGRYGMDVLLAWEK